MTMIGTKVIPITTQKKMASHGLRRWRRGREFVVTSNQVF
jgi:hypothetical protein